MPLIRPFAGLRPVPQHVEDVAAPPYDVLNSAEARVRAAGKPYSFLHISKAEIDLAEDIDPYDPAVYAKAAENLQQLVSDGILIREGQPRYYVYRLIMGDHVQTGLVAAASVKHYDTNRIRKHEFTRPAKENDRVNQIEALNAQTGPVLLAYKSDNAVDALLEQVTQGEPLYELTADDGIGHVFWIVEDPAIADKLSEGFDAMEAIYIADGHHRSASASRVAKSMGGSDDQMSHYFLSVIFPHKQMKIFDYNRVVADLNGLSSEDFISKTGENFSCVKESAPVKPAKPGEFGMYLGGEWYRLGINRNLVPSDPVARLDVSLLANNLLEPILNISDPRTDPRIDFVGGVRGLEGLEKRVDSGEMAVAFSMYATSMDDLIAVADANEVMPPKSTWFEPKLADGLVSHVLD
ncbi:FIG00780345: hypothetical protein [hydrothermal vent metagenome]|uniref:HTH domain of SpoOJ/ParA/ParB/repB family, involved in chromosome partitioning n=1 Tax=hydrothermal vent metagenome TaxID=652676 RepID=A0A3B0WPJ4_9ZZZZ